MRQTSRILLFFVSIGTISNLLKPVNAYIIFQGYGYDSQPAAFGTPFKLGGRYAGRIQEVADDPYLCGVNQNGTATEELPERQEDKIIVPSDGFSGEFMFCKFSVLRINFQSLFDLLICNHALNNNIDLPRISCIAR